MPSFKRILVPVDFTLNTDVAINKTLELVNRQEAVIYLFHVIRSGLFFSKQGLSSCEKKLSQWKETIREYYPLVTVQTKIEAAISVQKAIEEQAFQERVDLVVIGQTATHYFLPLLKTVLPMRLAASTSIPVLTVKPGALQSKAKTVVVPIGAEIPEIKIQALELLQGSSRLNVHLVAFITNREVLPEVSASSLLKVYQSLKAKLHCPVEYAVIQASNKAKAILQYAEKKNADILLVYPKKETRLSWWNQHIPDVLPSDSKVQVLAVQPV